MKTLVMTIAAVLFLTVPAGAQEAPPAEKTAPDVPPDILIEEPAVQGFVYDARGERDPFLRLVDEHGVIFNYDQKVIETDLSLEGILTGGGENIAIINSDIVAVGDMVGAYTVEGISTDTVILRKGQDELLLTLKGGIGHGY